MAAAKCKKEEKIRAELLARLKKLGFKEYENSLFKRTTKELYVMYSTALNRLFSKRFEVMKKEIDNFIRLTLKENNNLNSNHQNTDLSALARLSGPINSGLVSFFRLKKCIGSFRRVKQKTGEEKIKEAINLRKKWLRIIKLFYRSADSAVKKWMKKNLLYSDERFAWSFIKN